MVRDHDSEEYRQLKIDAAIGLLKFSGLRRRRPYMGEKIKKSLHQQTVLKMVYDITNFPSTETRNELALLLGIPPRSVQVWFQNKRQNNKRKDGGKSDGLVNEYQKFIEDNDVEDEVFDVPSAQLYDIIEKCRKGEMI